MLTKTKNSEATVERGQSQGEANLIKAETRVYRLNGITPILGSQPANPSVRTQYIASKAPDPALAEGESEYLPQDLEDHGLTVFLRDPRTGAIGLMDYVFKGFFKEALGAIKPQIGLTMHKKKVDLYLFGENVFGERARDRRIIPLMRDGQPLLEEDDQLERSLRADTAQGPRTTVAGSEMVNDPWQMEVKLTLISSKADAKALNWGHIEAALDYGYWHGLGQWRNGGNGRFTWEEVKIPKGF